MTTLRIGGDRTTETNVYLPSGSGPDASAAHVAEGYGGAPLVADLLRNNNTSLHAAHLSVATLASQGRRFIRLWRPTMNTGAARWTLTEQAQLPGGYGTPGSGGLESPLNAAEHQSPEFLVIVDRNLGYRHNLQAAEELTRTLRNSATRLLWEMAAPLCRGRLWWAYRDLEAKPELTLVIGAEELLAESGQVSVGLSWERTLQDVRRELEECPGLEELRQADRVIVRIGTVGALCRARRPGGAEYHVVFDARRMPRYERSLRPGEVSDVFLAAMAVALASAKTGDCVSPAMAVALHLARRADTLGHGACECDVRVPAFPIELLARELRTTEPTDATDYTEMALPAVCSPDWQIAALQTSGSLHGLARRVALFGLEELRGVPLARYGRLVTADRGEIEALAAVRQLLESYAASPSVNRPLCLAVFGPPGSGKSFGVKEIAGQVLGPGSPILEFNLTELPAEGLAGALHQVRDRALEGKVPIVFWDEFDSDHLKWLKQFLAPMNDGRFQEGEITHPIGRCVFVFAGGTSATRAEFEPKAPGASGSADPNASLAWRQFQLNKGPDFMSRLHGHLDVRGPNPRPDREADPAYPLRRALLLRAQLRLQDEGPLDIDPRLLGALLDVRSYTNGSRSVERICRALRAAAGRGRILPSHLPADPVCEANIADFPAFQRQLRRDEPFGGMADRLAPAIHDVYAVEAGKSGNPAPSFSALPARLQNQNRQAALRIPGLLALAGLEIVEQPGTDTLSRKQLHAILSQPGLLDKLAAEEHAHWASEKRADEAGTGNPDARSLANLPYAALTEDEKQLTRAGILAIPSHVERAGFALRWRS